MSELKPTLLNDKLYSLLYSIYYCFKSLFSGGIRYFTTSETSSFFWVGSQWVTKASAVVARMCR